ncbi:MAG TPA: hypothetical protein VMG10_06980 [Gemmataceae bacterium]|nr:hypothetical protein [Gemmataceae bacterium]
MRSNVNPFEPWRPTEAAVPPPLHAARPWRPPPPPPAATAVEDPPLVEPVNPPPRKKPPKRPLPPERPQGQPSRRRTPLSQLTAFVLFGVLTCLGLESMGWCRGAHLPRLMALGASIGLFAGMAFNGRRGWRTRVTWMAAALAVAGIALWFVPTMRGVNLWSAYRQVETLRTLPAGEVAVYQRGAAARRTLIEEFPSFAPDIRAAEQAWLRRTVNEAVESADRRLERDPHAALADLQRLNTELAQLEGYASVQKELETARARAVQACVKRVRREAEDLLDKK